MHRRRDELKEYLAKELWLKVRKGILAEVAEATGVSVRFARMVFWGERTSAPVLEEFRKRGAPISIERPRRVPAKATGRV